MADRKSNREMLLIVLGISNIKVGQALSVGKDHVSTWKTKGKIPEKYEDMIGDFLREKGILPKDEE
ncbi:MAG: hypothetical protein LHW59_05325 [Candidatus Cloacimonetes bacterium]|nr:hypothetical protein [Candidatus Cloacimonadota bacterium]